MGEHAGAGGDVVPSRGKGSHQGLPGQSSATLHGGGALAIFSDTGTQAVLAGVGGAGNGHLSVGSKTGHGLFAAGADANGNGNIEVSSKTGVNLIKAGANEGGGVLVIRSTTGKEVIVAGSSVSGYGALMALKNKTGETIVQLRADEYGNGVVGVYNRKGMGHTLEPGP